MARVIFNKSDSAGHRIAPSLEMDMIVPNAAGWLADSVWRGSMQTQSPWSNGGQKLRLHTIGAYVLHDILKAINRLVPRRAVCKGVSALALKTSLRERPPCKKRSLLAALALSAALIVSPAYAESQQQCEASIKSATITATHVGLAGLAGGGVGVLVGATACSGFLAVAIFDLGISFASCLAGIAFAGTTLGGIGGTSSADDAIIAERQRCARLAG